MDVEFLRHRFENGYSGVITKHGVSIGVRHIQMAYMFVSAVTIGAIRGSLGVAVMAMTDERRLNDTYIQIHDWDRRRQGAILSSFFFGYALLSLPAELHLKKLSHKFVVTGMLFVTGTLCVAMPTIANRGGWVAVCNAMLSMGMAQAGFSSVNQALLEKWLPPSEKKTFSFFIYGGIQLGIIIALPVSGIISSMALGWELIYYTLAMMTLSMAVIHGVLTGSSPDDHPAVGDKEKEFIKEALMCYSKKSLPTPWRKILTSPPFWAVVCAHSASNALFVFFLTDVPAYLNIYMNLEACGKMSMIPFILMWFVYLTTAPTLGWISNLRIVTYLLDVTNFRKLINFLGAIGIVVGLTIISAVSWSEPVIVLLSATLGLLGLQFSGFLSSYSDMSENHSETLVMLGSAVSSVVGATVPFITGLLVADDVTSSPRWRPVFLSLASLYVLSNVFYLMLGSNERQPWDRLTTKLAHYNGIIDANEVQLEDLNGVNRTQEKEENDTAC